MKRYSYLIVGMLAVLLVGIACGDDGAPVGPSPDATGAPAADSEPQIDFTSTSGIVGADPEFNFSALVWQGYWLSRDHFGPFVMASGMGIPFEPPMEQMMMAMAMVAQNPDDPVAIPQNMAPLQAVFASGSSDLINDPREFDPLDLEGLRLDPDTFDETVAVRGQAWTILKETQWAHSFADPHFGDPAGDFGAQQRFLGVMVAMLAQMQGMYAIENLMGEDGLYHDSDGSLDYAGNWVLLHAFSDLADITGEEGGRYMNPDTHGMFEGAATALFRLLEDRDPENAPEAAAAVRALIYRASTATDTVVRDDALAKAKAIADGQLLDFSSADPTDNAAAIAGLLATAAADGGRQYLDAAGTLFEGLAADFDTAHGVFSSKDVYSVDDVAWIIGGLNALVQQGNEANRGAAAKMLLAFYESTISLGGMQLSAPPGKDGAMAGAFEKDLPSVVYYHPGDTPPPPMVGKLTVPAEEITWDGSEWAVTSDRFVAAGAMHLANELNWLGPHLGSIPFPSLGDGDELQSDGGADDTTTSATVVGEDIAFDIESITIAAGVEVTITFDHRDAGVPHNFHVQAGAADVRSEIEEGPVTQTLTFTIDQPGSYSYVCDVHPGQMWGTLIVR